MSKEGEWLTEPAESTDPAHQLVLVTYRTDIDKFKDNPRFHFRIEVTWTYAPAGMPDDNQAETLEQVTQALQLVFLKDPVAVLTEMSTGAGKRVWVFYTLSLHIFQRKFNEALADLPPLPLTFEAFDEPVASE